MISGFLNQLARRNQAYTGKPGSSMYFDEKRKRYIIEGEEDEDDDEPPPPPPGVKKIIKINENVTDSNKDASLQQEKQKEPEVVAGLNSLTAVGFSGALANRGRGKGRGGVTAKAPVQSRFPQTFNPTQISNNSAILNNSEQEQKNIVEDTKNKDMPMQMNLDITQSHQALYTTAIDLSQSQILPPNDDLDSNQLKQSVMIPDPQDFASLDELTIQQQIEWEKLLQECEEMWQDKFQKQNDRIKILKDRVKKYQEELTHSRQENEQTIESFTQLCQDLKFRGMEEVEDLQAKIHILNQHCFLLSQDKAVLAFKNEGLNYKFNSAEEENQRLKNKLQTLLDDLAQADKNVISDQQITIQYQFLEPLEYGQLSLEQSEEKSKLVNLVLELQIENDKLRWELTSQRQNFIGQQFNIQALNQKFEDTKNQFFELDVKCKKLEKQLIDQASGYEDKIHEIQSTAHEAAFNSRQLLDRTAKERDDLKLILMDYQREQANDKAQNAQLTQKILLIQQQLAKKMENERILMSRAYQMRPFKTNRFKQKNQQKKIGQTSDHHSDDNLSDQIDGSSQNEDFDDSDTEFDEDEEFSGAEDSEGNQIEAKKIPFKFGVKQSEMHAKESKINQGVLHSQEIIQGDDASLRARKSFVPGNTEELQGKQADQILIASVDGITRDLKSSENAMQTEPTSIVGSHQSPTKQSLFDMIQKQIDNKITIEAPSEQFDDEEYSHGRDDIVGNQIRNHLRKVSQQQKQERNKRQTRKTMRQILKEQVEESRAQLKIDFEKRLQVERELHQQTHQLQLYKDGLSEIDGIIRGIMKSESITLIVKNRQATLEEEVGDQQYNDNLSERNQTIIQNPLLEDEEEDVLGSSQSELSKEDWDLSVETIINRIFEIQRHYQKDKTDMSHQISVLNMKLESQDSIVLDLEILQHEKTLADQELIQFKNLLGQAQLQIRQIQQKFNDVNEEASRAQIQLTTRDGEVDMLKKQVERLGQRNEQIRDQLDTKWESRVSELREHYEREIIPSMQTQAEKRFQSQLNRIQDQNNTLQEQNLDAERRLVQLQADLRQQKENLKMKENEKTQAQEEQKMRELEKEELKNTLDNLHQTMFSEKRLQEQRLADCQSNLIQQQQFCSQLQSQISDMIEKRDQYKLQAKELNQQLSQQDLFFKQQLQQLEQVKVQQLEQFNQQLTQQDLYYKQQIQQYEETKNHLNQVLQQTQSEILQKDSLIERNQSVCEQYQNEIKQLKIENEQKYSEQKQKEDDSFWSLVRQVNQLKEENNQKSQQINEQIIIINQREQQLAEQTNQLQQLQEQIQNENQQHEKECNSWSQRLESISAELKSNKQNYEIIGQQLQAEKQALENANLRIEQLQQNYSDDTEKSQLFDIIQQGKSEIQQLQQQVLVLQEQIDKLNQEQIIQQQMQNTEQPKDNFKTTERVTELEKLYEYQLQINDELNDKNQRLKMMISEKDKDIEILQNNQEEAEKRYIQNNNQERQQVNNQEQSTKKLFDDPEEVDVFAFYNNQEEVTKQPKNIMQWESENISSDLSTVSQVPSTENQEIIKELNNKVQLLQDDIQEKNMKINELVQQLAKQQEMGNQIDQSQKEYQQIQFQNEEKIKELEQSLQTLSQTRDQLDDQLETQKAQSLQEIEQIKVQLMESQYQLQLQQAELETKHEEEVKHIRETLGTELKKAISLHEATNTQLLQLQNNQQNSEEISNLLQIDNLQQKIKEQEDIISSLKSQPIDNNREQSYKKAAEDMANKFKEKINKEKEKNKKLQEINSSLNQELIKTKDEHSVQSLGYSQILDNLDQTRQDNSFKDVVYQALAGLVDVKLEDTLEIMIEKLNAVLANFQEDKRQLQQLIQLNAQLSQENQDLKDQNYDLRYEQQELGIKYQQSQDDLKQVLQKQAQLAEKDLIKEIKPKEIAKEIKTKEIPKETNIKEEKDIAQNTIDEELCPPKQKFSLFSNKNFIIVQEDKSQKHMDMPLQIEKAKEQVQSSLFNSIASFFLTESEIKPKVEQPENEYEYYEYDDETDHAI